MRQRHPDRKSLVHSEDDSGFGTLLGGPPLPAVRMEDGRSTQGIPQAKRVVALLRQGHRRVVLYLALVRIAQKP